MLSAQLLSARRVVSGALVSASCCQRGCYQRVVLSAVLLSARRVVSASSCQRCCCQRVMLSPRLWITRGSLQAHGNYSYTCATMMRSDQMLLLSEGERALGKEEGSGLRNSHSQRRRPLAGTEFDARSLHHVTRQLLNDSVLRVQDERRQDDAPCMQLASCNRASTR